MDIFSPVQFFANSIVTEFDLKPDSYLGSALNFFIYDTIKISILLVFINYLMAITRYYFPTNKVRELLTKRRWYGLDYLFAAFLGVVTPFCSCSSIPLFIGFLIVATGTVGWILWALVFRWQPIRSFYGRYAGILDGILSLVLAGFGFSMLYSFGRMAVENFS